MLKYIPSCILFIAFSATAFAQVNDASIEKMMSKKTINPEEIKLNTVSLIPRLYFENKYDTLYALLNYYEKNIANNFLIEPFRITYAIKNGVFKEEMNNARVVDTTVSEKLSNAAFYEENIISLLEWFRENHNIKMKVGYYPDYIREAYGDYFEFIKAMGSSGLKHPNLSPVQRFLLTFFSDPDGTSLNQLANSEYNSTALQRAWLKTQKKETSNQGVNAAALGGVWLPTGSLSLLGPHPSLGFLLGGKTKRVGVDLDINFRFLDAASEYVVRVNNQPHVTSHYFGGYIGVDGSYELFRKNKAEVDFLLGVAYEGFDEFASDNSPNSTAPARTISSFGVNAGFGYKLFVRHQVKKGNETNSYVTLQAKYHTNQYNNDGTNLQGQAFTISVLYGAYSKKIRGKYIKFANPKRT
jgi:hypothetical protein